MKQISLIIMMSLLSYMSFSQEKLKTDLLISEDSWGKEIISMPIHFAPQIPYKGIEEIRFAPGWSKPKEDGFWSYVFVWNIDLNKQLTANDLETYLQYYFDGLMNVVNKEKEKVLPKTVALFIKKENNIKVNEFVGKLQIYNAFHTKEVMQLHCTVKQYYCAEQQRSMVLFRFSPKDQKHPIWDKLNRVKLAKQPCDG